MILLNLLIITLITVSAGEYFNIDGRRYYISDPLRKNWHQAFRYCASLGMYLVDIRTELENKRVLQLLDQYNLNHNITSRASYWTSGTDLGSEGNFFWMTTGQQILYDDWYGNSPDNWRNPTTNETENCLILTARLNYRWNDGECSVSSGFICRNTYDVANFQSPGCTSSLGSD